MLNWLLVTSVVSIVKRTVGGLSEFARSELDEAKLAWRRRSNEGRRSDTEEREWVWRRRRVPWRILYHRKDFRRDYRQMHPRNSSFDLLSLASSRSFEFEMEQESVGWHSRPEWFSPAWYFRSQSTPHSHRAPKFPSHFLEKQSKPVVDEDQDLRNDVCLITLFFWHHAFASSQLS